MLHLAPVSLEPTVAKEVWLERRGLTALTLRRLERSPRRPRPVPGVAALTKLVLDGDPSFFFVDLIPTDFSWGVWPGRPPQEVVSGLAGGPFAGPASQGFRGLD